MSGPTVERYIRKEIDKNGSVRIGDVVEVCDCSRQYVYSLVNRKHDLLVTNGLIIKVYQGRFLQSLLSYGVKIEPELLSKAIEFGEQENFDLRTIYDKPFEVDSDGVGLLRVIQALLIAISKDLPFKMTLELD